MSNPSERTERLAGHEHVCRPTLWSVVAGENKYWIRGRHAAEPLTAARVSMRTSGDRVPGMVAPQMSIPCPRPPIASDAVGISPPPPSSFSPLSAGRSWPRLPWPRPTSTRLSYSIRITMHSRDVVLQAIRDEFHAAALLPFLWFHPASLGRASKAMRVGTQRKGRGVFRASCNRVRAQNGSRKWLS